MRGLGAPTAAMFFGLRLVFSVVLSTPILGATVIQTGVQVGRPRLHTEIFKIYHLGSPCALPHVVARAHVPLGCLAPQHPRHLRGTCTQARPSRPSPSATAFGASQPSLHIGSLHIGSDDPLP